MAIIKCPNCGKEISDQMPLCPGCGTTMPEIQAQNPKKKRTIPVLVPVLSILDGLILLGTVGLLTFGVVNPVLTESPASENIAASTDLATACKAISKLHINAARNYNAYHSDSPIVLSEEPIPVAETAPDSGEAERAADLQESPQGDEADTTSAQNNPPQQNAQPQSTAPVPASTPQPVQTSAQTNQAPASNTGTSPTTQTPKATTGSNGAYTHDFSGGRVLVTTASNNNGNPVYHIKDCVSARKISPNDEYWYASAEEAEADGRRLCGNCDR